MRGKKERCGKTFRHMTLSHFCLTHGQHIDTNWLEEVNYFILLSCLLKKFPGFLHWLGFLMHMKKKCLQ